MKAFDDYVNSYDLNIEKVKLKYNHSYRVMELSKKYAELLGFSDYDIKLATIIGLLHDIGRFYQIKKYDTFNDSISIDHATYGNKVLFEENLIKEFWDNEEDYEIIRFAIENHNKYKIENTDNERALMHAKLIRDTDKLDIIYLLGYLKTYDTKVTNEEISKEVLDSFYKHESILTKYKKNANDKIVGHFAFVFDINYDICLNELKDNFKYYYEYINSDKFKEIYNEVIKYIDERIDKKC